MDLEIQLAQIDSSLLSGTTPSQDLNPSASPNASGPDLQVGLSSALDRFMDVPASDTSNSIELTTVQNEDSPMSILKERVGEYVEFEGAIDNRLHNMPEPATTGVPHLDNFIVQTQDMLSLQMGYQYKSLNGALLLSTAKSAEGFVKTLMRSQ